METFKSFISKRHILFKKLNPLNYTKNPVYTTKEPKDRMSHLLLMRDLRLWVIEKIPHSNNVRRYFSEIEHLTREIRYLETKRGNFRMLFYVLFVYFMYFRLNDKSIRGNQQFTWYDYPLLQSQSNGSSALHIAETKHPKSTPEEEEAWSKSYIK